MFLDVFLFVCVCACMRIFVSALFVHVYTRVCVYLSTQCVLFVCVLVSECQLACVCY